MARKESGDVVSSEAAQILRYCRTRIIWAQSTSGHVIDITSQVEAVCASLLSQDETKGKRKTKRRGRR